MQDPSKTKQNSARTRIAGRSGPAPQRKLYSAPALEKGLDILELLALEPQELGQKEIADRLGRSVGEIFRMLAVLEQREFVRLAADSERYQLTMKLFQLAHWHLPVNRLIQASTGPMRRLALRTGQSCHLTTLSVPDVVVLYRQESFGDRSFAVRVGAQSPVLDSCSGQMFFALSDDFTRETIRATLKADSQVQQRAAAAANLAEDLRRTQLLELPSSQVEGITDIGTPVLDINDSMTAALIIPFLHRIDRDNSDQLADIRSALVEAGREIGSALRAG